jgi:hypothetical protein
MAHLSVAKMARLSAPVEEWSIPVDRVSQSDIMGVYHLEGGMRTLVDLPESELEQLNVISRARKISRAELIRQAVSGYLAQNKAGLEDSFGLWKKKDVDGVAYQERLRSEWE